MIQISQLSAGTSQASDSRDRLPGIHNRCNPDDTDTTRGKGAEDNRGLSVSNPQGESISEEAGKYVIDMREHISPSITQNG